VTNPPLPANPNYNNLLGYYLLRPEWTEEQVIDACDKAAALALHSVVVRPCDVEAAVRTGVRVGSVCGWPFGDQTTGVKLYEARDLLRRGAKEIDFVLNPSRLLSRQFQATEMELMQAVEACHKEGAVINVVFPNGVLTYETRLIGARICSRVRPTSWSSGVTLTSPSCARTWLKISGSSTRPSPRGTTSSDCRPPAAPVSAATTPTRSNPRSHRSRHPYRRQLSRLLKEINRPRIHATQRS